jgi:DHA1 family tetracycline resistance protein-like MFS transporter
MGNTLPESISTDLQYQAATKRTLAIAFTVIVLDLLGGNLLAPVVPFLVRQYSLDALSVGLLSAIYAGGQFFAAPFLGLLSDRIGRRPVLLVCLLGSAIGYIIFGIGGALWVLFLSRLIDGITGGNISVATACIVDITPPEKRAQNFGLMGVAFGIGFLLGPTIGGALGQVNLALPAFFASGLSALSLIFAFFYLPETRQKAALAQGEPANVEDTGLNPLKAFPFVFRQPGIATLLTASFLFSLAFAGMVTNIGVFLVEKYQAAPIQLGVIFIVVGITNIIAQGFLVRWLTPKFGEKKLALAGLVLLVLGWLGIVLVPSFWMVFPLAVVSGMGSSMIMPTLGALIANQAPEGGQGQVQGVSTSLSSVSNIIGPLLAGLFYDRISHLSPYTFAAALCGLAFFLITRNYLSPVRQPVPQG